MSEVKKGLELVNKQVHMSTPYFKSLTLYLIDVDEVSYEMLWDSADC